MPEKCTIPKEEMLALREQGLSNAQIAEKLGISYITVKRYIGNQPQSLTEKNKVGNSKKDVTVEKILELRKKGLSCAKIASKLGVSDATIWNRLKKAEKIEILPPGEAEKVEKVEKTAPKPEIQPETAKIAPVFAPTPTTLKKQEEIPVKIFDFSYIPNLYGFYDAVMKQAVPEPWEFKEKDKDVTYPGMAILTNYINRMFTERALEYNSCNDEEERNKIILFHGDYCYIHSGLYTTGYRGLYLVFGVNRHPQSRYRWYSLGVRSEDSLATKGIFSLPEHRQFMVNKAKPFNPNLPINISTQHIIAKPENLERFPESIRNAWNLPLLFETAIELSRRIACTSPQTAVLSTRVGDVIYLLPLYFTNPEKPDLVAVLEDVGGCYFCRTAITPNMAYLDARLNGRPTVKWLTDLVEPVK